MDLLVLVFIWPFLLLAVGLVFIALGDLGYPAAGFISGFYWVMLAAVILFLAKVRAAASGKTKASLGQLDQLRLITAMFSIALLAPVFVRYVIESFNRSLPVVIIGLLIGFALAVWGIFMRGHKVLMYGNIIAGALTVMYVYSQLWQLGDLARIVAAGFGLLVAVLVSVIKLKDQLV